MAKTQNATVAPIAADSADLVAYTTTSATGTIKAGDKDVDVIALPPSAIAYLLQYGLSKSLQDSASGVIKAMTDLYVKVNNATANDAESEAFHKAGKEIDGIDYENTADAFANAVADARKARRLADILAGTVSHGSTGPRARGIDRVMQDIAESIIVDVSRARGLTPKSGKDMTADAVAFVAKWADKVLPGKGQTLREMAQARVADAAAMADLLG